MKIIHSIIVTFFLLALNSGTTVSADFNNTFLAYFFAPPPVCFQLLTTSYARVYTTCDEKYNILSLNVTLLSGGILFSQCPIDWTKDVPYLNTLNIYSINGANRLAVITNSMINHPNLQTINLYSNKGVDLPAPNMTNMVNLRNVNLLNINQFPILPTTMENINLQSTTVAGYVQPNIFTQNLISYKIDVNSIAPTYEFNLANAQNLETFSITTNTKIIMDWTQFSHTPAIQNLYLNGLTASPREVPSLQSLNLTKLVSFEVIGADFNGTLDSEFFKIPTLKSLVVANSPDLTLTIPENQNIGRSLVTLNITNTNTTGTIPLSILNSKITRFDIRNTAIRGYVPTAFFCLPPNALNPNINSNPKYLFDKVFLNYNTTYVGTCAPNITSIQPYPLQINSTITISGNNIIGVPGSYSVTMSNTVGDVVNINCVANDLQSIICTNGQIQGEGTLTLQIFNGNSEPPQDSFDFTYQPPLVTSATPCPTLGGTITINGYDLVDPVGLQENSDITVLNRKCDNIKILTPYRQVTCDFPAGVLSNVPFAFKVKGILSNNQSVNFYYKAPYVLSSNALTPNVESDLTITGSDFWNDRELVKVTVGPQGIICNVTTVNHDIIICRFPSMPYTPGAMNINVSVLQQTSQPNQLFQYVDEQICPNSCSGNGTCSVSVGFCVCKGSFGPACNQKPTTSDYNLDTALPTLTILAENNITQLQATLISVIENDAETLIPNNWKVTQYEGYTVYNWTSKMTITIRKNLVDGQEQLGGLAYTYPANSYTYSINYDNPIAQSPSLQFKFSVKVIPEECKVPPMTLAYPTNSGNSTNTDLHWSLITQYNTEWAARFPQSANVNGGYGYAKTSVLSQTGSSQILLVNVVPGTQSDSVFSSQFELDFTAYPAKESRSPTGACDNSKKSDNRWKIAVGVVVGVVGGLVFVGLIFYVVKQQKKLGETQRLLDKKLAELNGF